jgi:hypothetical protein
MTGKTGSLNVSVAAGIALSHIALWKEAEPNAENTTSQPL